MMATSSLSPQTFQGSIILHKSYFLSGQNHILLSPPHTSLYSFKTPKQHTVVKPICAKFNLFELLGGRGLCNGEAGIEQELKKDAKNMTQTSEQGSDNTSVSASSPSIVEGLPENAFEKEMLGLTGGFPGGEKGLKKFIQENPPLKEQQETKDEKWLVSSSKKAKAPELPLLLPGMIAIVKNPNNPFYMYCGIVQRITDGKAGVIFEGGNWDRLVTFRLEELERREKGPPMVNPKSVVLEKLVEKLQKQSSQQSE